MIARVYVTLKPGVLDPQGRAVAHSLAAEGFSEVKGARIGKLIEVEIDETDATRAKARVAEMCEKLLANTVIERYDIELPRA